MTIGADRGDDGCQSHCGGVRVDRYGKPERATAFARPLQRCNSVRIAQLDGVLSSDTQRLLVRQQSQAHLSA